MNGDTQTMFLLQHSPQNSISCGVPERGTGGSSPGQGAQSRDDDAGQAERALLAVLVQEHLDAAFDLLELLLAHGHGDGLLLEALHLPDQAAVDVSRVALQRHLGGRDELAGAGRGLRSVLQLVPAKHQHTDSTPLSHMLTNAFCSLGRKNISV